LQSKIKEIVKEAGEILKEGFYGKKEVKTKTSEIDLVTEYDVRIEEYLKEMFEEYFPEFNFIGEESDNLENYINDKELKNYFVVDPIDGTSNFVKGFPYVSISVAVYKEGKEYYGIVYNPIMNELYEASARSGEAFLNNKKIEVKKGNKKNLLCSTYISRRKQNTPKIEEDIINTLTNEYSDKRTVNSAALELCYVARGIYGLYAVNLIKPWDIAAGAIILKEAGGVIETLFGEEINILKVENIKAISY